MISTIKKTLIKLNPINFSILLTLFFIITHFQKIISSNTLIVLPLVLLSSIGILFEEYRQSKQLWIIQALLYFLWVGFNWQTVDNHIYLWGYWLLAIGLGLYSKSMKTNLRLSAKYLIACCMTFALIQKLNPTFLSGDFFYFELITDARFSFIGELINTNLASIVQENRRLLESLLSNSDPILLNLGPPILKKIATVLTWYVIALEGLMALVFFLPRKYGYAWQHWLMLLFLSTYFILPIKGFAFALLTLAFVLVKKNDWGLKLTYIMFMFYILIFSSLVINALMKNTMYSIF